MSEILGLLLMMRMMRRRMRCWWCCWLLMLLLLLAELVVGPYSSWLISLLGEGEWEGTPPLGLKQGGSLAAAPLGGDTCKHSTERGGSRVSTSVQFGAHSHHSLLPFSVPSQASCMEEEATYAARSMRLLLILTTCE